MSIFVICLIENDLWHHVPLYHVKEGQHGGVKCPICNEEKLSNYLLYLRNCYGPEYRDGILTHAFALVVVRRPSDETFLVVQEIYSGFWLPGGTLEEAAIREIKEEAGIDVEIKGILQKKKI